MKKLLLLPLLVLPWLPVQGATFTSFGRTFFTTGYRFDIPPCEGPGTLFLTIPYTNVSSTVPWMNGSFMCQRISNSSPADIRIKMLSFQAITKPGPEPSFTGFVMDGPNFTSANIYGYPSISTNRTRDGVYMDLVWEYGKGPVVPARTDFYIGARLDGATATKSFVRGDGTYYLDGNYEAYNNGVLLTNSDYYLDIYTCP